MVKNPDNLNRPSPNFKEGQVSQRSIRVTVHLSSLDVVRPNLFSNLSALAFVDTHRCEHASASLPTQKKTKSKSTCPCCSEERIVNGELHFGRAGVSLAVCANPEFLSKFDDAGVGLGAAEGTTFCVCSGCCKATRRALKKVRRAYPLTSSFQVKKSNKQTRLRPSRVLLSVETKPW